MKIDPETADRVRHILLLSRSRGVDPVPLLDRANLLNHPAKRQEYAALITEGVVLELTTGPVASALNAMGHRTPMDMKNAIIKTLEGFVQTWRSEQPASKGQPGPGI